MSAGEDIGSLHRQIGSLIQNQRQMEQNMDRFTAQYQVCFKRLSICCCNGGRYVILLTDVHLPGISPSSSLAGTHG